MTENSCRELDLFKRYSSVYDTERAAIAIRSVHLSRQLEVYISANLDRALITRNVIDLSSDYLYSNVRGESENTKQKVGYHELCYAKFIIQLATLLMYKDKEMTLTKEQVRDFSLNLEQEFYFGQDLATLNRDLVSECSSRNTEVSV